MKIYKTGDMVMYEVPMYKCTKCDCTQVFDPAMEFFLNIQSAEIEAKTLKNCQCGNDEFSLIQGFRSAVGMPAEEISKD